MQKTKRNRGFTQFMPLSQRYFTLFGACVYTGKEPEEIEAALEKGQLKWCVARDGSKSLKVDDLDEYMHSERGLSRVVNSCARRKNQ